MVSSEISSTLFPFLEPIVVYVINLKRSNVFGVSAFYARPAEFANRANPQSQSFLHPHLSASCHIVVSPFVHASFDRQLRLLWIFYTILSCPLTKFFSMLKIFPSVVSALLTPSSAPIVSVVGQYLIMTFLSPCSRALQKFLRVLSVLRKAFLSTFGAILGAIYSSSFQQDRTSSYPIYFIPGPHVGQLRFPIHGSGIVSIGGQFG